MSLFTHSSSASQTDRLKSDLNRRAFIRNAR